MPRHSQADLPDVLGISVMLARLADRPRTPRRRKTSEIAQDPKNPTQPEFLPIPTGLFNPTDLGGGNVSGLFFEGNTPSVDPQNSGVNSWSCGWQLKRRPQTSECLEDFASSCEVSSEPRPLHIYVQRSVSMLQGMACVWATSCHGQYGTLSGPRTLTTVRIEFGS